MSKTVIILGGSGFIGSYLQKNLSIDAFSIKGFSSKECNLLSFDSIQKALSQTGKNDVIVMTSSIIPSKDSSFDAMQKNLQMTYNLSHFIETHEISQLIFLSTVEVYGLIPKDVIITENLLPSPSNYYAVSKLASEFILKSSCLKKRIPLAILRLPGVYGDIEKGTSAVDILMKGALKGKITLSGDNKRDLVYIDDMSYLIQRIIQKRVSLTLNIATGKSYPIIEIVHMIKYSLKKDFVIEHQPKEGYDLVYDVSLFNKIFPDFTFTELQKGISLYASKIRTKGEMLREEKR